MKVMRDMRPGSSKMSFWRRPSMLAEEIEFDNAGLNVVALNARLGVLEAGFSKIKVVVDVTLLARTDAERS
jgi:hypothetical protein